jgi:putative lipoprotein
MEAMVRIAVMGAMVAGVACASSTSRGADGEQSLESTPRKVVVSVTYRERIMVPSGSELDVRVVDATKSDSAATIVAEKKSKISGGPPYLVSLEVPPELFIDSSRYEARASIMRPDSTMMFETANGAPVLTMGAGDSVEVLVRMSQP